MCTFKNLLTKFSISQSYKLKIEHRRPKITILCDITNTHSIVMTSIDVLHAVSHVCVVLHVHVNTWLCGCKRVSTVTVLSAYRVELTKNHSAFVQTVISREHNIFKGNCLVHVIA